MEYAIICCAAEPVAPIAYLDDARASGGRLSVQPQASGDAQVVFATGPAFESDPPPVVPYAASAKSWRSTTVSETLWADGHTSWVIRCLRCGRQAQLSDGTAAVIADELAANRAALACVPHGDTECYLLPFGVLLRRLAP